jgi:hypothetical protein
MGRALKVYRLAFQEPSGTQIIESARRFDAWLAEGAPLQVLQTATARIDPDGHADRVAVVREAAESGPEWPEETLFVWRHATRRWQVIISQYPHLEALAAIDLDGDRWREVVAIHRVEGEDDRTVWVASVRHPKIDEGLVGSSRCGADGVHYPSRRSRR